MAELTPSGPCLLCGPFALKSLWEKHHPKLIILRHDGQVLGHLCQAALPSGSSPRPWHQVVPWLRAPGQRDTFLLVQKPHPRAQPQPRQCQACHTGRHRRAGDTLPFPQPHSPSWTLNIYEFFKKKKAQTSNNVYWAGRSRDDKRYLETL